MINKPGVASTVHRDSCLHAANKLSQDRVKPQLGLILGPNGWPIFLMDGFFGGQILDFLKELFLLVDGYKN